MDLVRLHSLFNELENLPMEKVARSYVRDFLGGVDPTGTSTFQYGMRDTQGDDKPSAGRRALGTAGGLVGGAAVIPGAVSGLTGAVKGGISTPGGIGRRLIGAGRGLLSGAASPYTSLARGLRARRALKTVEKGMQMSKRQGRALQDFVQKDLPSGEALDPLIKRLNLARVPQDVQNLARRSPEQVAKIRQHLSGQIAGGGAALGLSGLVGAGSAYMQYGKGAKVQRALNKQLEDAKTASVSGHLLRAAAKRAASRPVETVVLARGAKKRAERGKRRHRETMRALDERNPYPAGWVPLGMRPRR